jgi:hypothetical protein
MSRSTSAINEMGRWLEPAFRAKADFRKCAELDGTDGRTRMETSVRGVLTGHGAVDTTYR